MIVVTHDRTDLALATLRSARAAAGALDVQWLVIDSGSTDDTPDAIEREFPDVSVRRFANIGFAGANNRALPLARGRYVLLLNPDVEIVSGTLADLLETLDARPEVGIASVIQQGRRRGAAAFDSTLPIAPVRIRGGPLAAVAGMARGGADTLVLPRGELRRLARRGVPDRALGGRA